jgi:hypothetical protein
MFNMIYHYATLSHGSSYKPYFFTISFDDCSGSLVSFTMFVVSKMNLPHRATQHRIPTYSDMLAAGSSYKKPKIARIGKPSLQQLVSVTNPTMA